MGLLPSAGVVGSLISVGMVGALAFVGVAGTLTLLVRTPTPMGASVVVGTLVPARTYPGGSAGAMRCVLVATSSRVKTLALVGVVTWISDREAARVSASAGVAGASPGGASVVVGT